MIAGASNGSHRGRPKARPFVFSSDMKRRTFAAGLSHIFDEFGVDPSGAPLPPRAGVADRTADAIIIAARPVKHLGFPLAALNESVNCLASRTAPTALRRAPGT